jgi:predicted XRE-type DNA-binding protein
MVWATDVFLERDDVREALKVRDFGVLFRLLSRVQGVSQTQIAATTGLTQGRVSRVMCSGVACSSSAGPSFSAAW